MLILPVLATSLVISFMVSKYNISPGSIKEVFSLPFQQTARYVRDYASEVTSEEKAAIDKILDYDNLGEFYNEGRSDRVKETFNSECTSNDLINYFKVWLVQFTKHPVCYFEATLNQNYYIFYPFDETLNMYTTTCDGVYAVNKNEDVEMYKSLGITEYEPLSKYQSVFVNVYRLITRLPILSLFCSNAFYILVFLSILVFTLNKRKWDVFVVSIPIILSILVVIASPVINTHPRYAFPISYLIPLFSAYYLFSVGKCDMTANVTKNNK